MTTHIGKLIKTLRKSKGLTQKELAAGLSRTLNEFVHPNYISRWETTAYPPSEVIVNVCAYFDVHPCEMFYLDEPSSFGDFGKLKEEDKEIVELLNKLDTEAKKNLVEVIKRMSDPLKH